MTNQPFQPESKCKVDSEMTRETLLYSFQQGESVSGKVLRLSLIENLLTVQFGNKITCTMPMEEITIYPIFDVDGHISPYVYTLVGKVIQVKILAMDATDIRISRKENMNAALEYLKKQSKIPSAIIKKFSDQYAFLDIGAGIIGKIDAEHFSKYKYRNISHAGFKVGDSISPKVLRFNKTSQVFDLSLVD